MWWDFHDISSCREEWMGYSGGRQQQDSHRGHRHCQPQTTLSATLIADTATTYTRLVQASSWAVEAKKLSDASHVQVAPPPVGPIGAGANSGIQVVATPSPRPVRTSPPATYNIVHNLTASSTTKDLLLRRKR